MMPRVEYARMPFGKLHLDPANARKHGQRNLDVIRASLRTFTQVEPLVVQKSTGRIIGGNGRFVVLREEGALEAGLREFSDAVERAVAEAEARDVALIARAAEKNWQAAAWRLERRAPARWGRREQIDLKHEVTTASEARRRLREVFDEPREEDL
jgi:hypothetical protein